MKMASCLKKVVFLLLFSSLAAQQHLCAADPTDGFTSVEFTDENRMLQKPYDKAPEDRYSKVDGHYYKKGKRRREFTVVNLVFKPSSNRVTSFAK
ncbi:hypothetical protein CerSpe_270690 [Prunus speciosa]